MTAFPGEYPELMKRARMTHRRTKSAATSLREAQRKLQVAERVYTRELDFHKEAVELLEAVGINLSRLRLKAIGGEYGAG